MDKKLLLAIGLFMILLPDCIKNQNNDVTDNDMFDQSPLFLDE